MTIPTHLCPYTLLGDSCGGVFRGGYRLNVWLTLKILRCIVCCRFPAPGSSGTRASCDRCVRDHGVLSLNHHEFDKATGGG